MAYRANHNHNKTTAMVEATVGTAAFIKKEAERDAQEAREGR
jgi:hypothetical protein